MSKVGNKAKSKRLEVRDQLWPDAANCVFDPSDAKTKGYAQIPRLVPLVARLINEIGGRENAGNLYQVLWVHDWGQALVEVRSFKSLLYQAGYNGKGSRAERTWQERVKIMRDLGFIRTARKGLDDIGYILLVDPRFAVRNLEKRLPKAADPSSFKVWLEQFKLFCTDWGIPPPDDAAEDEE